MSKQKLIREIVEIVMSGVPLNFFESRGFLLLNGEMARKLSVSFSRKSIRRYVIDAANQWYKVIKQFYLSRLLKYYCLVTSTYSFFKTSDNHFPRRRCNLHRIIS